MHALTILDEIFMNHWIAKLNTSTEIQFNGRTRSLSFRAISKLLCNFWWKCGTFCCNYSRFDCWIFCTHSQHIYNRKTMKTTKTRTISGKKINLVVVKWIFFDDMEANVEMDVNSVFSTFYMEWKLYWLLRHVNNLCEKHMVARCVVDSFVNIPIGSFGWAFSVSLHCLFAAVQMQWKAEKQMGKSGSCVEKNWWYAHIIWYEDWKVVHWGLCICDFVPFSYDSSFENVVAQKLSLHID